MMKPNALFQSDLFDLSSVQQISNGSQSHQEPAGKDLAEYVHSYLTELKVIVRKPTPNEDHWVIDLQHEGIAFLLLLHWVPIGKPSTDWWVIRPYREVGVFKALFYKQKQKSQELTPVCDLLHRILDVNANMYNLRWVQEEELWHS
jgi:hypothetical protein